MKRHREPKRVWIVWRDGANSVIPAAAPTKKLASELLEDDGERVVGPFVRAVDAAKARQRSAERRRCVVHALALHGKEAEELRRGIEKILSDYGLPETSSHDGLLVKQLQRLLDRVDARDSLAYLERRSKKKGRLKP